MKIINQCGRSMVEMLGVLAIVGVLSVGGLAGYQKAMFKYRVNKTIDQISQVVSGIRTTFVNEINYQNGLGYAYQDANDERNERLLTLGIISKDMISSTSISGNDDISTNITNLFQGGIWIFADESEGEARKAFVLSYGGLNKDACMALAIQDWNTIGAHNVTINGNDGDLWAHSQNCIDFPSGDIDVSDDSVIACPHGKSVPIPIPLSIAEQACSNCDKREHGCNILWGFVD